MGSYYTPSTTAMGWNCSVCGAFVMNGQGHVCAYSYRPPAPQVNVNITVQPKISPGVLSEIKARALRIQDERSGRGKYKDLEAHEANSLLADLLLLIEALEV